MFEITYWQLFAVIAAAWIAVRIIAGIRNRKVSPGREAMLLMVFVCIAVIARIVYFPWHLIDGRIGTLKFDGSRITPFWLNMTPFVFLRERYDGWQLNVFGNIAMFIPVGVVWPVCFGKLNGFWKTLAAGAGFSALIEITQLLFYDRSSDIDDLILNTLGVAVGTLIYFGVKKLVKTAKKTERS